MPSQHLVLLLVAHSWTDVLAAEHILQVHLQWQQLGSQSVEQAHHKILIENFEPFWTILKRALSMVSTTDAM